MPPIPPDGDGPAAVRPRADAAAVDRRLSVLGVPILQATPDEADAVVADWLRDSAGHTLYFANAHTLNLAHEDPAYRRALEDGDVVLNDGAGVGIAGRLRGRPFPANLNGTDYTPRLLRLAAGLGRSVYLLGGREGIADQAAERLCDELPALAIAGTHHGYFAPDEADGIAAGIRGTGADVVLVALGNPRQELWLDRHFEATGARIGVGVGAFLDFTAGIVPRAPRWMNSAGVEWVYRLAKEPGRLRQRYLAGNPRFLWRVGQETLHERVAG